MFRPVRLFRVTIQVPDKYMSAVMAVLGDLKLLHLINVNETQLGKLGYIAAINIELLRRYEKALKLANTLIRELEIKGEMPEIRSAPQPEQAIFKIEERLAAIESEVSPILERGKIAKEELIHREGLIKRLTLLLPAQIDFTRLKKLKYLVYTFGLVPTKNLLRLEESLSDIHHALIKIGEEHRRTVVMAVCLKEDSEIMLRALKSAFWEELALPADVEGPVDKVIEKLESSLPDLSKEVEEAEDTRKEFAKKFGSELLRLREETFLGLTLIKAQRKFGKIDHTYLLTGWVPVDLFETLKNRIMAASEGQAIIDQIDPDEIQEVRAGIVKIPILFNNPLLIKPFERLTSLYGTPSYHEVEPTVFFAVSFVLLFGMMFGDVGHGLILFIAGYYIFKRLYKHIDLGIILMECGLSSTIFGVLYGSVFGLEDVIPALWLHPMKDITHFMKVSAFIGVGMISLGLILNLVNIIKQRRYSELLSATGLAGALAYWLIAGLAVRYITTGGPRPLELAVAKIAIGALLGIMILFPPLKEWLRRKRVEKEEFETQKAGLATLFLESLIEALDGILRFIANTISFVRVAAFALTHAALFIGVFSIADMVSHGTNRGFSYYLTLVIGNIVIIVLEGVVVSIQTIRLEYYEFFSKFFRGGGEPFRPIVEEMEQEAAR